MPRSMTGFARLENQHPWGKLSCEIRSVNHRYLEPSLRLPDALRNLETALRDKLRKRLGRGKVEVNVYLKTEVADSGSLSLNRELARELAGLAQQVGNDLEAAAPVNALDILQWPGVIQMQELDQKAVESAAATLFDETLNQLIANREREGTELARFIEQRLDGIGEHVGRLRERLPELLEQQRTRLREKIDALQVDVDEDRFTQEVVYLAQKADVAEELDRLEAHLGEVRHTLGRKEPIGRRLDFLMQELNREANTLSSKSTASETSQQAVDLKVLIEQMREQIQNIE